MILEPKGHYCVIGWTYGSEIGRLEMDGVSGKAQARELATRFLCKKYKLDPRRLRIKEVFIAGKGQGILRPTGGTPRAETPSAGGLLSSSGDRTERQGGRPGSGGSTDDGSEERRRNS